MRFSLVVVACSVACVLGAVQGAASVVLRARAVPPALAAFVPAGVAERIDRLPPSLPLPGALRLVLARAALERGDVGYARASVRRLGPSRDRLALEAELAQRDGDRNGAVRLYLAAGDLAGVEAAVDRFQSDGRIDEALALQEAVVANLAKDRTQLDALAQATYRLGEVCQAKAYTSRLGDAARRALERRSLAAYARAVELSPLSERYLIALANERIDVGDFAGARRTFERARDNDPTSAEPWTGLGDLAFRRGDRMTARAMLARARSLDPRSAAVERLARELQS